MDSLEEFSNLLVRVDDGVAWATMNRPHRLNALDPGLIADLTGFFTALCIRPDIRVVVLTGAGEAFCAGLDLKDSSAKTEGLSVSDALAAQRRLRDILVAMRRCPQPIIAVLNGAAAGGGFGIALAADVRLAVPTARMNAAFIRLGVSGCDMGASYFLPRMIGSSLASYYLLTGRFLHAARARELGLIAHIGDQAEVQAEVLALCSEMLAASPLGLRLTKDALGLAVDLPSLEAVLTLEDRNQVLCLQGRDFAERVRAFVGASTKRER